MDHLGADVPSRLPSTLALPDELARLLTQRGEGTLAGTLKLRLPGSAGHAALVQQLNVARAAFEGTPAWLLLRSPRGPRSTLLGEGFGSFLMVDPSPISGETALWILHRNGTSLEVGADLDDLVRVIMEGALHRAAPLRVGWPDWLSEQARLDPTALGIPLQYDTRAEDSAEAWLHALRAGDDDACDAAFEHLISARVVGHAIGEARRVLAEANLSDASLRSWQKPLDRMEQRNPVSMRLVAELTRPIDVAPALRHLEEMGMVSGGELGEHAALALATSGVTGAFRTTLLECARLTAETRAALMSAITSVKALDAYAWLALSAHITPDSRPTSHALVLDELPPPQSTWPAILLAVGSQQEDEATKGGLAALALIDHPLIAQVLEERLLTCAPHGPQLIATFLAERCPCDERRASVWFDSVLQLGSTPKAALGSNQSPIFALLERSTALDSVMAFYLREHNRAPISALQAARNRGDCTASRSLLHALYTGSASIRLRLEAAALADAWGDARAPAALAQLDKAMAAQRRRGDGM